MADAISMREDTVYRGGTTKGIICILEVEHIGCYLTALFSSVA